MNIMYDVNAPKKPTNLTINSDLVKKAKDENINISLVVESALAEELRMHLEEQWKKENNDAINMYNKKIEEFGLFSDGIRSI